MNGARGRATSPERADSLWPLVAAPAIWAVHFLASYVTAAVWSAKVPGRSLAPVRSAIVVYTLLALVGIAAVGWRSWRRRRAGGPAAHAGDEGVGFLGHAGVLLAGLGAVAVLFTCMAAVIGSAG